MMQIRDSGRCYVCGKANSIGLQIDFEVNRETRSIRANFTPSPDHQGFEGIVHGGILAAVLDEAMAKLAFALGIPAVTAEITVTFKSPAAPGDALAISGSIDNESKKLIHAEAKIERGLAVIAAAKGKLLRISS